jgi:hypothetical protein
MTPPDGGWKDLTDAEIDAKFDAAYNAARLKQPPVIDAEPISSTVIPPPRIGWWRRYRANWANAPIHICLIAVGLVGIVLPYTILFGGILCLAIYDSIVANFR